MQDLKRPVTCWYAAAVAVQAAHLEEKWIVRMSPLIKQAMERRPSRGGDISSPEELDFRRCRRHLMAFPSSRRFD
jgi:hypothetical protein